MQEMLEGLDEDDVDEMAEITEALTGIYPTATLEKYQYHYRSDQ